MSKKPFVFAQATGGPSLTVWGQDDGLPETTQSFIMALVKKHAINRPFVTVERPSKKLLNFLKSNFEVKSVTYSGAVETIVEEGERILNGGQSEEGGGINPERGNYESLVVSGEGLDAFLYTLRGPMRGNYGDETKVYIFFDDPAVFNAMMKKADIEEELDYPIGNYSLEQGMFGYYLMPLKISKTDQPILDEAILSGLHADTDLFFSNKAFYKGQNPIGEIMPHKRGILLVGPPGNGKSTAIKSYLSSMRDKFGVIIDSSRYMDSGLFKYLERTLGSKQKVFIFEDVDGVCQSSSSRSAFLNFLDGPSDLENTLTIATTNYPERLDESLISRPSRFDSIVYVGVPDVRMRSLFLLKWFPELKDSPERLEALAIGTDGFSGAFFKEIFCMVGIQQLSIEDALQQIQTRKKNVLLMKRGQMDQIKASASQEPIPCIEIDHQMLASLQKAS